MKEKKKLIILVTCLIVLIAGGTILYQVLIKNYKPDMVLQNVKQKENSKEEQKEIQEKSEETQEEPEKLEAVDFTVQNWEGEEVKLSDYFGKPIVLNFWASWCGPCKSEMGEFQKVYEEMGEDIHFLMINATGGRETVESAKEYVEKEEFTFPVFFDVSGEASYLYGVTSLPSTLFIDADGYVITGARGAIDEEILRYGITFITDTK